MSLPWRKRLDYQLLRWQARFEGMAFDRGAPWALSLVFGASLLLLALARSRELSQDAVLAEPMQVVWQIGQGVRPDTSLLGHNFLWEQGGFLIYPVAWLANLFPTAITLLTIQSFALAVGIVPLWRLARGIVHLRVGATLAITIAYAVYGAVHALNIAGFHLETLALPALLAAVHAGFRERWVRYAVLVAIVLGSRADLGLVTAGLGVLWWVEGKRRLGYLTSLVGIAWLTVLVLVVQPRFNGGAYPHVGAFSAYGTDNPFNVLWGIVTSPVLFARELFSQPNFATILGLLAPVLFLPVVAPRYLLPTVPSYCLYLVADVPAGDLLESGQTVPVVAFVFVALTFALAKTGRVVVQLVNVDRRVVGALLLTATVFFVADSVTSPYREPWSWGRRDASDLERRAVAELLPDDAVVRAAPKLLPLLTERYGLFELRLPAEFDEDLPRLAAERVNWVVVDQSEIPGWTAIDRAEFRALMATTAQFDLVFAGTAGVDVYAVRCEAERNGVPIVTPANAATC